MDKIRLTKTALKKIRNQYRFIRNWEPDRDHPDRPVWWETTNEELPEVLELQYGRRNNDVDTDYTCGITSVGLSDGKTVKWVVIYEGDTPLSDVLAEMPEARFVIAKYVYRSLLVCQNPGAITYTLFNRSSVEQ